MPAPAVSGTHVCFGPFELDVRSGELRKGPTRLKVPDQSVEILKALLESPGELVSRDQLRERLWTSDTFVDFDHGLNAAVRRLREALGDSADTPQFIETLPKRGYRFIGVIEGPSPTQPAERAEPRAGRQGPTLRLLLGTLVILIAVLGWFVIRGRDVVPTTRSTPVTSFPGLELDPALSPDGNHVAYASQAEDSNNVDLYVKLIDGGAPVPLAVGPGHERSPAWSPDGRRLAFLRGGPRGSSIVVIPAFGGAERVVTNTQAGPAWGLAWTPDGRSLIITDFNSAAETAIFLCSLETAGRHQLTQPTRNFADANPAVSPDGRHLAFVRRIAGYPLGRVFVQQLDRLEPVGEPRPVTEDNQTSSLAWADNDTIIYDGFGLWRVSKEGGAPKAILTNVNAAHPSVARDGSRLLYSNVVTDSNIWRIVEPEHGDPASTARASRVIASTSVDTSPQIPAQGDRIAFVSERSGNPEIWAAGSDGSNELQLTTFGGPWTGSPRWSDDGRSIAFDSMQSGTWNIYVVGSQGGRVRSVTQEPSNNVRPSWSRDGRWIYFGSNRGGDWQVWKAPSNGGTPVQITKRGGWEALESPDGKSLYYAKAPGTPGIWRVPVNGGDEIQVLERAFRGSWAVTERGIYCKYARPQPVIELFEFATERIVTIARLAGTQFDMGNPSFAVSRDGQQFLYVKYDRWSADIEMLPLR